MTEPLFREDAYLKFCYATVVAAADGAVVLDRTVFYPMGGGQPGDTGVLRLESGATFTVVDTRKGEGDAVVHRLAEGDTLPPVGSSLTATLDWERRYCHMRMHTCLHLLGAVIKHGVTGGSVGAERSRLDFDMQDPVDKEAVTVELNALINADYATETVWITDQELAVRPELIRTLSVKPPAGAERVRLLNIEDVDLQPCGGTHVMRTGEIGSVRVSKVEKKGRHNRRVAIVFDG